jgi:hypothetical protein
LTEFADEDGGYPISEAVDFDFLTDFHSSDAMNHSTV